MDRGRISTGNYLLNKFLAGGIEEDIITTIFGPGGSGKTNFCMILCVSLAKKKKKVIYVDSEGGFSTERFKQIHGGGNEEIKECLKNIILISPTTFKEQEDAFLKLLKYVNRGNVSLIIIDSIAMLYRLELGDAIASGDDEKIREVNRKLARQLSSLNEIARKRRIPVVVTNQVYSFFSKTKEDIEKERIVSMVGGDLLKYWSKCLIELQNNGGRRKMILRKHRSISEKELNFEITKEGIRKRGFF